MEESVFNQLYIFEQNEKIPQLSNHKMNLNSFQKSKGDCDFIENEQHDQNLDILIIGAGGMCFLTVFFLTVYRLTFFSFF